MVFAGLAGRGAWARPAWHALIRRLAARGARNDWLPPPAGAASSLDLRGCAGLGVGVRLQRARRARQERRHVEPASLRRGPCVGNMEGAHRPWAHAGPPPGEEREAMQTQPGHPDSPQASPGELPPRLLRRRPSRAGLPPKSGPAAAIAAGYAVCGRPGDVMRIGAGQAALLGLHGAAAWAWAAQGAGEPWYCCCGGACWGAWCRGGGCCGGACCCCWYTCRCGGGECSGPSSPCPGSGSCPSIWSLSHVALCDRRPPESCPPPPGREPGPTPQATPLPPLASGPVACASPRGPCAAGVAAKVEVLWVAACCGRSPYAIRSSSGCCIHAGCRPPSNSCASIGGGCCCCCCCCC
jgi:hypothetical protein